MNLHPEHLADLHQSGLTDKTIEVMGVRSAIPHDVPGFEDGLYAKVNSIMEIPYPTVPGFSRYKPFPAIGEIRYYQPRGTGNHLYILPPVVELLSDFRRPLAFIEGEKKAAAGWQHGQNAIGFSGIWNWKETDNWKGIQELQQIPFSRRGVEIIPDSDTWMRDDLQQAIYAFARYLEFRGARVVVVQLPQTGNNKIGLDDFFVGGNGNDDFKALPRLALKDGVLRQHKEWYSGWKADNQDAEATDDRQGKPLFLREIEPYDQPVNGAELLTYLCRAIRRYVVTENPDIVAIALWCVHAHAIDAFAISPFLNLSSPEKGCGKSTTLTVISRLVSRPILSASMSPASIFRAIELYKPSFLIDEADTFENLNEELRGLLNASHLRETAQAIRTVGDDHEPRMFSTWCPKAISLIGRLPDTLNDRSIVIEMKRRRKDETCTRFSALDRHPELDLLRRQIARWVKDNFDRLRQARPKAEGIDLRLYDNWMPLLAIADILGGDWPNWARITAGWFATKAAEAPSIKVELLTDIATVMGEGDRMFSEDLVKALGGMADRPWSDWKRGKPLNQVQMARMLKTFGIKSGTIRIGTETAKGYYTADIVTARNRYAPAIEESQASQKTNESNISSLEAIFVTFPSGTTEEAGTSHPNNSNDDDGFDWQHGEQCVRLTRNNGDKGQHPGEMVAQTRIQEWEDLP